MPTALAADAARFRAFFAAERAASAEAIDESEVPRSLRAAVLAGLAVACGLAGLEATATIDALRDVSAAFPDGGDVSLLAPALILLAVIGGGRSAATSLLFAHGVLSRTGHTGHLAYAAAGAIAAALVAAALLLVLGHPPAHGLATDILAGAAGGFFYRVFAGVRRVASDGARGAPR